MILILTDEFDVHADIVIEKLKLREIDFFRLNLNVDSLKNTAITYKYGCWFLKQESKIINCTEIKAVWCRRSTVSLTAEQERDISNDFRLWRSEWNRALFGLYNSLSTVFWLNNIRSATLADNKFYQFRVAESCGLKIPNFITSNNKSDLVDFFNNSDQVALKFMSQDLYYDENGSVLGLYVNKLNKKDLDKFQEYSENPITLQRYIEKDFEVRYTVIENDHFVCRISSQLSDKSNIDWRRYDIENTPHISIKPNIEIQDKVNILLKKLNLSFGALDFIVDKNGDWWFLEVNSTGQWLWIEDLTGLKISDGIVKSLIHHVK